MALDNRLIGDGLSARLTKIRWFSNGVALRRAATVLAFTVTFACGAIAGVMFSSNQFVEKMKYHASNPEKRVASVIQQLEDDLQLSSKQIGQIEPILRERFAAIESKRQQVIPEVLMEHDKMKMEVEVYLNEQQKESWVQLCDWVKDHCYARAK